MRLRGWFEVELVELLGARPSAGRSGHGPDAADEMRRAEDPTFMLAEALCVAKTQQASLEAGCAPFLCTRARPNRW